MGMRPPFLTCNEFEFCSIDNDTSEFLDGLSELEWARLAAGAERLACGFADGRRRGRSQLIRGSDVAGLFEFKATLPGGGPQLRLLCLRQGKRILCARGFRKDQARVPRSEIEAAERAIKAHREDGDEPEAKGTGP
jgi:hypothetical protein